jgi:hypothetical protein
MVEDLKAAKYFGKIRAISINVQQKKDIENCLELVDLRIKA